MIEGGNDDKLGEMKTLESKIYSTIRLFNMNVLNGKI